MLELLALSSRSGNILQKNRYECKTSVVIRVGYGFVAYIHEQKLKEIGVETFGYIEINPAKQEKARQAGYEVFSSYEEAAYATRLQNVSCIWDICTNSDRHVSVLREILRVDPRACVIVEKPICMYSQISELRFLLCEYPEARIVVNENYISSGVTRRIRNIIKSGVIAGKKCLTPVRILAEMTKNRWEDYIVDRRFLDYENGAFGYELSHMLTAIAGIDEIYLPDEIKEASLTDGVLRSQDGQEWRFLRQGTGEAKYTTKNKMEGIVYTSMTGEIGYPCFPYSVNYIPYGDRTKYRVLAVECQEGITIVGLYEPIPGLKRGEGAVLAIENCPIVKNGTSQGKVVYSEAPIPDDTMGSHLQKTLEYFRGTGENPCDLETGMEVVDIMYRIVSKALEKIS